MTERVLLVKLAALGDAIMASTLVPAVRAQSHSSEITWVTSQSIAPLVRLFEGVDHVVEVDERELFSRGRIASVRAVAGAWRQIKRGYDHAIVAHTDARYGTLSWLAGARRTSRFAGQLAPRQGRWHGAEYLRLLDQQTTQLAPAYARLRYEQLPLAPAVPGDGPLVVIAPGGARNVLRDDALRRWPLTEWVELTRLLVQRGYRVAAVGGAGDQVEGDACAAAGARNFAGTTSLLELTSLLRSSDAVVTHDSGTLHLALLLDRPVVALFGPTIPAERIPDGSQCTVLSSAEGLPCAPCYNGFGYAECALNLCLTRVRALSVAHAVETQLGVRAS